MNTSKRGGTMRATWIARFWRYFGIVSGTGAVAVYLVLLIGEVRGGVGSSPQSPYGADHSPTYYCEVWYSDGFTPSNLGWLANALGFVSGPLGTITQAEAQAVENDCAAIMAPGLEEGQAEEMCTMMGEEMYGGYENCMADYGY